MCRSFALVKVVAFDFERRYTQQQHVFLEQLKDGEIIIHKRNAKTGRRGHADGLHLFPRLTHGSVKSTGQISVQFRGRPVTLGTGETDTVGDAPEAREDTRSEWNDHDDGLEVGDAFSDSIDHIRDA